MNWSEKKRSGSFKNTLDYVLHDKDGNTTERVGVVECLNLAEDAYNAHAEMKATHQAAPDLKTRFNIANAHSRTEKPVFHYTLSWHPDDRPEPTHMIEQARHTLKLLGLEQHQTVIVEHKDRPHRHLHVVASLLNPETGRTASLSHFKLKLDRWAHEYEQSRIIRSPRRAARHNGERTMNKADPDLAKRKAELRKKIDANYARREKQKERLWEKFRVDRSIIRETAQSDLDEIWKRKPTDRSREPAGPKLPRKEQELKLWAKAMRMIEQPHSSHKEKLLVDKQSGMIVERVSWNLKGPRSRARLNFREALTKIGAKDKTASGNFGQAKNPKLSRPLEQHKDGRDVMLPARNTAASRRYAAVARQTKKQRSDEIRAARDLELQNCANLYERDKGSMKEAHDAEIKVEKQEKVALWREGKRAEAEAVKGLAKEAFTRVAVSTPDESADQNANKPAPEEKPRENAGASRAKELYETLAAELRATHGYTDAAISKALHHKAEQLDPRIGSRPLGRHIEALRNKGYTDRAVGLSLRIKADGIDPGGWRNQTETEKIREASIKLNYPQSPYDAELNREHIAIEAIQSFVDRLGGELKLTPMESYNALQQLANDHWLEAGPHSRWTDRDREEGRNLTLDEHVEADRQEAQSSSGAEKPAEPAPEQTWRDRIDTVEESTAPEQDNTTGTWRDAAKGSDWSGPMPDKGNDRGGRGM
jgi:hypothetical protein